MTRKSRSPFKNEAPEWARPAYAKATAWQFLLCEQELEARGVEPLSSSLSTQTSTCLSGAYSEEPTLHRHTTDSRASANFLHRPARSLRRSISLLSTFGAVAGVQLQTSRSIKPRELDLGDLRLFVLVRFLTRPTNHPRHAACASNDESKPVRPHPVKILSGRVLRKFVGEKSSVGTLVCSNLLLLPKAR
jgi:hypothetical protein